MPPRTTSHRLRSQAAVSQGNKANLDEIDELASDEYLTSKENRVPQPYTNTGDVMEWSDAEVGDFDSDSGDDFVAAVQSDDAESSVEDALRRELQNGEEGFYTPSEEEDEYDDESEMLDVPTKRKAIGDPGKKANAAKVSQISGQLSWKLFSKIVFDHYRNLEQAPARKRNNLQTRPRSTIPFQPLSKTDLANTPS